MSDTFKILAGFLEKYSDDVEGRSLDEAPAEVRKQLLDFACGRLNAGDRAKVSQLLKEHPQWVTLLAQEARNRASGSARN